MSVVCRCNKPLQRPIRIPVLKRLDLVLPWKGWRAVNLLMTSGKIHTDALLFGADKYGTVMPDEDGVEYGFWYPFAGRRGGNGCCNSPGITSSESSTPQNSANYIRLPITRSCAK